MKILIAGGTGLAGRVLARRARAAGHDVRVLSRSAGPPAPDGVERVVGDLVTGQGLDAAVAGVDVVADLSNVLSVAHRTASRFFTTATRQLVAAGAAAGVRQHLLLSVVGIDRFPGGYYRAKLDQEETLTVEAARAGLTATVARVTQFHDFAAQTYRSFRVGPVVLAAPLHVRPVHLVDVADHLLGLVERPLPGRAPDLSGPRPEELLEMVRRYARAQVRPAPVLRLPLPPRVRRANEARVLAPEDGRHGTRTFDSWLQEQQDGHA